MQHDQTVGHNYGRGAAEKHQPHEYCLEHGWTEPDNSTFNQRSTKFFHIVGMYNQIYVCCLMAGMAQPRCVKFDQIGGGVSDVPVRAAIFIKGHSLMVVLDTQASLFVYWSLSKLCKIQLHSIVWTLLSFVASLNHQTKL
jgi:hypothetical protein